MNGAEGSIPMVGTSTVIAKPFGYFHPGVKSDPDERRSRLQKLCAAHEMVFFHQITRIFRSLRANRPGAAGVTMA